MTLGNDPLDRLAPPAAWEADWSDVLARAGTSPRRHRRSFALPSKRRLLLGLVVLFALLIPLAALGAAKQRWFWWSVHGPSPASTPSVIKEGEWSGHPWQLVAYRSASYGLFVSLSPKNSSSNGGSDGGAMGCEPIAGVPRTAKSTHAADMTISFVSGAASSALPAYVVGPVIEKASEVAVEVADGEVVRVPTFSGPDSLGRVRFYATQLPSNLLQPRRAANGAVTIGPVAIAGIDHEGQVVACLVPATARGGMSPLSDCQGLARVT